MSDLYDVVADGRRRLADTLDGLTAEQWQAASLCAGWTSREVLAHLVMPLELKTAPFLVEMVKAGFNFDKVNDRVARRDPRSPAELLEAFRAKADTRFHPPGFGAEAPLTDLFVHGRDICRPLGIELPVVPDEAVVVLDLVRSPRGQRGFGMRGRLAGLRLVTTDPEWSDGEGAEVRGTAEDVILAVLGRAPALDRLEGAGVEVIRDRLG